jgi:head-tail adaptor
MTMRAGSLDRTIVIQKPVFDEISDSGEACTEWLSILTARAEVIDARASEAGVDYGEAETVLRTFRMRWPPKVNLATGLPIEITTAARVLYEGVTFDIKDIVEIGRRRGLELRCERIRS